MVTCSRVSSVRAAGDEAAPGVRAPVFLDFSLLFLAGRSSRYVTGLGAAAIGLVLTIWLFAYLPIALRRVYGGSRLITGLKLTTLGVLYMFAFFTVMPLIFGVALLQF